MRTRPRSPSFVLSTIVLLGLWFPCALFAQTAAKPASSAGHQKTTQKHSVADTKSGYAYFFDLTGDFEKIDLASRKEAAHRQIPAAAKIVDPFQTSGVDGCVFCGARYDRKFGRFYLVMAKQADDSDTTANSADNFEIVAVAPPGMQTITRSDVSFAVPTILVNPEGTRVLASYQLTPDASTAGQLSYGLSIFRAPELKLVRADKESTTTEAFTAGYVFKSRFSEHACFGPDGSIYDQFSRSTFADDQLSKAEIDPVALLVKSGEKMLAPFALVDVTSKAKTFEVTYVDLAAGQVLAALNASGKGPQALIVIDLKTQSTSSPMKVSQVTVPATHLTPDGEQIVIEESELRHRERAKADEPQEALFKTGKVAIFNVATGAKIREISAPKISGFDSSLLCMSGDAKSAFFAHEHHLFVVDLMTETTLEVPAQPQFVFDKWTKCVMADR